jgi:hypothetical protein
MKTKQILNYGISTLVAFLITFNSFSQDSIITKKILLLQKTSIENGHERLVQKKFRVSSRVAILRYSNDTVMHGRIKIISDSSIVLNGKTILLKDIKRINASRGPSIFIIGASIPILTLGITSAIYERNKKNDLTNNGDEFLNLDGIGYAVAVLGSIEIGAIVELVGIIDAAVPIHCRTDKGFVIKVKTVKKKK